MNTQPLPGPADRTSAPHLSDKAADLAHDFLSALFMGVRTAQIHDPSNAAFVSVANRVHQSGVALFAALGSFELKVVDDSFFINGARLRLRGKAVGSMRSLREILESQEMGGFHMATAPTYDAVRRMISVFATAARADPSSVQQDLTELGLGVFGLQQFVERGGPVKVDRRIFAVHSYAKLILGLREHAAIIEHQRMHGRSDEVRPRIRLVRVIQDLAELCDDRLDLLLKLGSNAHGTDQDELVAANTCVVSLALGHAMKVRRRDLGDIGMAALFSQLGRRVVLDAGAPDSIRNSASLARILSESGVGHGLYTRAMVLSEQTNRAGPSGEGLRRAHPYSRLVRVASAYAKLITGLDQPFGRHLAVPDALGAMRRDRSGWLDPSVVDLLVNLLRAYPRGAPVVLQSGHAAVVAFSHPAALDKPRVRVADSPPREVDLRQPDTADRIRSTQLFLGIAPARGGLVESDNPTPPAPTASLDLSAVPAPDTDTSPPPPPPPSFPEVAAAPATEGAPKPPPTATPTPKAKPAAPAKPRLPPLPSLTDLARKTSSKPPAAPPPPAAVEPPPPASVSLDQSWQVSSPSATKTPGPKTTAFGLMSPSALPPDVTASLEIDILEPEIQGQAPRRESSAAAPTAYHDFATKRIGTYLGGKYRILEKIGEGGMGAVYLANQEPIDRKVAVKVLLPSLAGDDKAVLRFEQEAKSISRMRHPNTVTIYDFGKTAADELYIVMEYLEGETLTQVLRSQGAIPPDRAARIVMQACAALTEAHQAGIVHRDLKPDNIFLTQLGGETDWVKILDFGLAKLADNEHTAALTQQGKVFGTPRYVSPEQAEGHRLDPRSDLYTLGVVLHELLCGQSLFDADTMMSMLVKHISAAPPPLSVARPDLGFDPNLEQVVLKALAKRPEDRHESCTAFAAALAPFAYPAGADVGGRRPTEPGPRGPPSSTHTAPAAPPTTPLTPRREFDRLISGVVSDLTPFDGIAEDLMSPFAGLTPAGEGDKDK